MIRRQNRLSTISAFVCAFMVSGGVAAQGPEVDAADQGASAETATAVLPPGGYGRAAWAMIEARQAGRGEANGWAHLEEAYRMLEQVAAEARFAENELLALHLEAEQTPNVPAVRMNTLLVLAYCCSNPPELQPLAEAYVAAAVDAGVFRRIAAAAEAPRALSTQPEGWLLHRPFPTRVERAINRACRARAAVALRQHSDEFVEAISQQLSIGRILSEQGFWIEYMMGLETANLASASVVEFLLGAEPEEEMCSRMLDVLGETLPLAPLTFFVGVARLEAFDTIDYIYEEAIDEATKEMPAEEVARRGSVMRERGTGVLASQVALNAKADEYYRPVLELAALPHHARVKSPTRIPEEFNDALPIAYSPVENCLHAFGEPFYRYDKAMVMHAGARVMLALEVYRARHGKYPEALAPLVPEILGKLPDDPFSTDGLRYRRINASADPQGRGYLLYSVGRDGEDQGGVEDEQDPTRAIRNDRVAPGFDLVINSRR